MEVGSARRVPRGWVVAGAAGALICAIVAALGVGGIRLDLLVGESMMPGLRSGALLVQRVIPAEQIFVDDVVTLSRDGHRITHRVQEVEHLDDGRSVVTLKGDAAGDPEPAQVVSSAEKLLFQLPGSEVMMVGAGLVVLAIGVCILARGRARQPRSGRSRLWRSMVAASPLACALIVGTPFVGVTQGAFTDRAEGVGYVSATAPSGPTILPGSCSSVSSGRLSTDAVVSWTVGQSAIKPTEYQVTFVGIRLAKQFVTKDTTASYGGTNSDWMVGMAERRDIEVYVLARARDPQTNQIIWESDKGPSLYGTQVALFEVLGGNLTQAPRISCKPF